MRVHSLTLSFTPVLPLLTHNLASPCFDREPTARVTTPCFWNVYLSSHSNGFYWFIKQQPKNSHVTNDITFNYNFNIYKINFIWTIFIVQVNHSTLHPGFWTQYKNQMGMKVLKKISNVSTHLVWNKTKCTSNVLEPWM